MKLLCTDPTQQHQYFLQIIHDLEYSEVEEERDPVVQYLDLFLSMRNLTFCFMTSSLFIFLGSVSSHRPMPSSKLSFHFLSGSSPRAPPLLMFSLASNSKLFEYAKSSLPRQGLLLDNLSELPYGRSVFYLLHL